MEYIWDLIYVLYIYNVLKIYKKVKLKFNHKFCSALVCEILTWNWTKICIYGDNPPCIPMQLAFGVELFSNSSYNFHSFFNSTILFMLYCHILHTDTCMTSLRVMHICTYFSLGKMWPLINMQCGTVVIEVGSFKMHNLIILKTRFFKHAKGRYLSS